MLCPRCGTTNPDTNAYCESCGSPLQPAQDRPTIDSSGIPLAYPRPPTRQPPPLPGAVQLPDPRPGEPPGWQTPASLSQPSAPQYGLPRTALPQYGSLAGAHGSPFSSMACGVCGAPIPPGQPRCPRCQTQFGYIVNPNDPTATDSLPFGPHIPLTPLFRAGADEAASEPGDRIRGFNWGAALLPTVWAARHRLGWLVGVSAMLTLLLCGLYLLRAALHRTPDASGTLTGFLVTCVLLFGAPRSLFAGLRGNSVAWRSGLYPDRESLRKAQRSWTMWAIIGVTVLTILLRMASTMMGGG